MPSFDTVSEVDMHEVTNAVDQAKRELTNRWDFKNVEADIVYEDDALTIASEQEFQLDQLMDMLRMAFSKRGLDQRCLNKSGDSHAGKQYKRHYSIAQGIDKDTARKIVKLIKDKKMKVQAAIQGDKVRVTGKKRDDLQQVMAMLREENLEIPLQFNNFRD